MAAKWTRRGFFGALATAAVGACVAAKIDAAWLPAPVRRWSACERLRKAWLAHGQQHGEAPREMVAGRALYDAYESEITANFRFTYTSATADPPSLRFKTVTLRPSKSSNPNDWTLITLGREAQGEIPVMVHGR